MKYFDHLIIGAGIGGTYCAARLKKIKPNDSIIIIDKNSDFGGLQTSVKTYDGVTIELGPVRFYESIHLRINALAEKYKTPLVEYLPSSDGQVAYLRGKQYKMTTLFPESDEIYNINQEEKGKDPFVLLETNLKKLIPDIDDLYTLEGRIDLAKNNKQFSTRTFQELAQMELSQENFQRIIDVLGYDNLLTLKLSFIVMALEFLSLSNKSQKQFRFKEGYSSLTKKIADKSKIKIIKSNDIINNTYKRSCAFNTEIIKIKKSKCDYLWIVTYGTTKVNSIEQINNNITNIKKIKVKNIYYTGSTTLLTRIYKFNNEYQNYFKYSFTPLNTIRIYLRFSEDWMTNNGIGFGKSVTTLPGGQIIHYDNKYVMFYIFGSQSNVLHSKIPSRNQVQKKLVKPSSETTPLIEECLQILKKTFNITTALPLVTDIAWATWIEPFRIHTARNLQTLDDADTVFTIMNKLMFPFGRNGNFYILSNEIGLNAAWCDGSVENIDYFLHKKYNQQLFGPTLL